MVCADGFPCVTASWMAAPQVEVTRDELGEHFFEQGEELGFSQWLGFHSGRIWKENSRAVFVHPAVKNCNGIVQ